MSEERLVFVGIGKGVFSLSLWFSNQSRRFLELLGYSGFKQEYIRESDFPSTDASIRRLALICALPAETDAPQYHLIWDVPSEFSDGPENHAQLLLVRGLDESRLVNNRGEYTEPSEISFKDLTVVELSCWPQDLGGGQHFVAHWHQGHDQHDEELSGVLLSFLSKGRPNGGYVNFPENGVIFSLDVGWSLIGELVRCLVSRSRPTAIPTDETLAPVEKD